MRIAESARKHQVADEDMLHAARNPLSVAHSDEGFVMLIGPGRDSQLLEVGLVGADTDDPVLVHAMPVRPGLL